jgi:hypothetical protein
MTNLFNPDEGLQLASFYGRAIPRMLRTMLVVAVLLLAPVFWLYGWAGAVGVAAGSAISYINFRTLIGGVEALGDRIVNRHSKERCNRTAVPGTVRVGRYAAYASLKVRIGFPRIPWGVLARRPDGRGRVEAHAAFRQK